MFLSFGLIYDWPFWPLMTSSDLRWPTRSKSRINWPSPRKTQVSTFFIFRKRLQTIYDKMKSDRATELTGYALESWDSQLSNTHPVSSVAFIVNSLKTFSENEKRTYLGLAGAGPIVITRTNMRLHIQNHVPGCCWGVIWKAEFCHFLLKTGPNDSRVNLEISNMQLLFIRILI